MLYEKNSVTSSVEPFSVMMFSVSWDVACTHEATIAASKT